MYHKTRGIVLHHIKYNDSSIIAYIYTELFGRQTYIIKGVHGKKSKIKINIFAPLQILELNVSNRSNRELQIINEAKTAEPLLNIPVDITKSSVSVFIAEILYKSLREETPNPDLFHFLTESILQLDKGTKGVQNFHLYFLMKLTKYLGFFPENNYAENTHYFDMAEGHFVSKMPVHPYFLDRETAKQFSAFINILYENINSIFVSKTVRDELLSKIIQYYQVHLIALNDIKSREVLRDVFS